MIAGADEPATLSGLCQPMAKIAMVQEKTSFNPDSMSLPPALSGIGDAMLKRVVGPSEGCDVACRCAWAVVGNMGRKRGTAGEGFEISSLAHSPGVRAVIGPAPSCAPMGLCSVVGC